MLFMPGGVQEPIRIQGPFISEKEVESIVEFIKYNNGEARQKVDFKAEAKREEEEKAANNDDKDTLFVQAGTIIIESNQASASMLQRRLKVGYARAARIIDQLEMDGVIGPFEGNKPREVLMTLDEFHEKYLGQEE
jgi:S-DNA-T family DNA segregation ATPase FtsK/SpoIIIE